MFSQDDVARKDPRCGPPDGAGRVDAVPDTSAMDGDSPTWDLGSNSVLWVDRSTRTVHRFTPGRGDATLDVPQQVGAAKPRSRAGLVLHLTDGIALFEANGEQRTWLVYWAREGYGAGATTVDSKGRLWAATMRQDGHGAGWLTMITGDGRAQTVLDDVVACHGLAFSPDDLRLYLVDSPSNTIDVCDIDADSGRLTHRRPLCEIDDSPGQPAGLCVDADGALWVALRGGSEVRRYTPDGVLDRSLPLPVQAPTGCCFGGSDLQDLYITSAREGLTQQGELDGSLLVVPGAGTGIRSPSFAG